MLEDEWHRHKNNPSMETHCREGEFHAGSFSCGPSPCFLAVGGDLLLPGFSVIDGVEGEFQAR